MGEVKESLESQVGGVECSLQGSPVILSVPVLLPCLRAEHVLITVDTHTGMLQCHVPQYEPPMLQELQSALNTDTSKVAGVLSELRWVLDASIVQLGTNWSGDCYKKITYT